MHYIRQEIDIAASVLAECAHAEGNEIAWRARITRRSSFGDVVARGRRSGRSLVVIARQHRAGAIAPSKAMRSCRELEMFISKIFDGGVRL